MQEKQSNKPGEEEKAPASATARAASPFPILLLRLTASSLFAKDFREYNMSILKRTVSSGSLEKGVIQKVRTVPHGGTGAHKPCLGGTLSSCQFLLASKPKDPRVGGIPGTKMPVSINQCTYFKLSKFIFRIMCQFHLFLNFTTKEINKEVL